ncbi:MAG: hypothetical protein ACTSX1_11835 [Candidatus Heimdallarchaeaceae archaeon]
MRHTIGKGKRPTKFQDSLKISKELERIQENEKKNPTVKFDKHKKKKVKSDGRTTYVY